MYGVGLDNLAILGDVLAFELLKVFEDGLHVGDEHGGGATRLDRVCGAIMGGRVRKTGTQPDLSPCRWWHWENVMLLPD